MDNYYGNICYCRRCNGVVHTIKKGDTLYLISKYYKVPIGEIMGANRNINIYNLQIGDEICIPVRRPEPRESDVNDMMGNNMTGSIGNDVNNAMNNAMNNVNSDTENINMMRTDMQETIQDMQPETVAVAMEGMSDYMSEADKNNETAAMDRMEDKMASRAQNITGLKVSELIGDKDITVEELAKLMKKYM